MESIYYLMPTCDYDMQLRVHRDGYILGSEYISDLVEGEHKKEEQKDGHKDELKDLKGIIQSLL